MRIKGKTMIELTDVNTGEIETVSDDNMITNALNDFFSKNIDGMMYYMGGTLSSLSENMLPICPNAIGGILLFSENLEEDADKYYAPSTIPCVGYASNDINATENVKRGSLNLTESHEIENGYKFVWDFTTSQANGTIAAVALTHKMGGEGYMGDLFTNSAIWRLKDMGSANDGVVRTAYTNAVEVNFDGNYFYSISLNTSNELIIQKVKKSFRSLGLNDTLRDDRLDIIEEHTLQPTIFIMDRPTSNNGRYDFFDGRDGYWYGFWHDSNVSGNATFQWIKISKDDYSFAEGNWTIENAALQEAGYHYGYNSKPTRTITSVVRNGYLYMVSYDRQSVYKININNSADVEKIELGFTSRYDSSSESWANGTSYMFLIGDWIVCSDFMLDLNDNIYQTVNSTPFKYTCTPLFQDGPFIYTFGGYNDKQTEKSLFLLTPYFASINNLSTAVVKTADKTMKITYTLTETDE